MYVWSINSPDTGIPRITLLLRFGRTVGNRYKRNGIGSALLKQAEIWAKENGAVGIRLCSGAERVNAHKFYESQGYEVTKLQKNLKKIFNSFGG